MSERYCLKFLGEELKSMDTTQALRGMKVKWVRLSAKYAKIYNRVTYIFRMYAPRDLVSGVSMFYVHEKLSLMKGACEERNSNTVCCMSLFPPPCEPYTLRKY